MTARPIPLPAEGLCRYREAGRPRLGVLVDGAVVPTAHRALTRALFASLTGGRPLPDALPAAGDPLDPGELDFLPPVEPRTMLFCGRNYEDHLAENPRPRSAEPVFFSKLPGSLSAHGRPIHRLPSQHVDYEGELAVVIGRTSRAVTAEQALSHVLGYTIVNDVSDRAVQHVNHQITMGKGPDTFGPMGPWLVPRAVLGDASGLSVRTWVNGQLRQDGSTRDLIHDVRHCVESATRTATLQPGDVIATGTPAGTGAYMDPPTFLMPGDRVRVAIEGLGALDNHVIASPYGGSAC